MNVVEVQEAFEALARSPFDPDLFPIRIAEAVGVSAANVARLRRGGVNRSDMDRGTLLSGKFHIVVTDSDAIADTLLAIGRSLATQARGVRIALATDGVRIAARDLKTEDTLHCAIEELGDNFAFFLPLAGFERFSAAQENPVDIRATSRLTKLYDALMRHNPDWALPARRHEMNQFMTRIVFCFFAEDTGILEDDLFTRTVTNFGGRAGESVQGVVEAIFTAMARPEGARGGLPAFANMFPYVNGGLFAGSIAVPSFNRTAFDYLKDGGSLDWREINPDIFGSMMQSIADPAERADLGMHYTSVPNILKAIEPLFLDALDEAIQRGWGNSRALRRILDQLAGIRIFDPACGSGNFLVVAYRELRDREMRVIMRLRELEGCGQMALFSRILLSSFRGIEITDFAAETAKLSLHIAEYQANCRFAEAFGHVGPSLPLGEGGRIVTGNALRIAWEDVCPPDEDGEFYIVGNPPFSGFNSETEEQKRDKEHLFEKRIDAFKKLDFVSCWFLKTADFIRGRSVSAALVATNSICQGNSVARLWPALLADGVAISFAHRSFLWRNKAAANAAVMCVIVGLSGKAPRVRRLFSEDVSRRVSHINAYLIEGPDVYVERESQSLFGLPRMDYGNMPSDGGHLILSPDEREAILQQDREAARFIRRYMGSREVTQGIVRYCLWISDAEREGAIAIEGIRARVDATRAWRLKSDNNDTVAAAETPHRFWFISATGAGGGIIVPGASSVRRPYLPVDMICADVIAANTTQIIYGDAHWPIALIASRMHLLWIEAVCGRIKNDFRYSATLGWHTFPIPALDAPTRERLSQSARAILVARAEHHPATIASLYGPGGMPADLAAAHRENDRLVESLYGRGIFATDADRLAHLFSLYVARTASAAAA